MDKCKVQRERKGIPVCVWEDQKMLLRGTDVYTETRRERKLTRPKKGLGRSFLPEGIASAKSVRQERDFMRDQNEHIAPGLKEPGAHGGLGSITKEMWQVLGRYFECRRFRSHGEPTGF